MGRFDFFARIGATPQAVAVLNDQPYLFTVLIVALATIALQIGVITFIHFATMKPEQKKKKKPAAAAGAGAGAGAGGGGKGNDRRAAGSAPPAGKK